MKTAIILLLMFTVSQNVMSYPFFYKCGANGELEDNIIPIETLDALVKLIEKKGQKETYNYLCKGNLECIDDFKKIVELGTFSKETSNKILRDFLERMKKTITGESHRNFGIYQITENEYQLGDILQDMNASLLLCQEEKLKLSPESLIRDKCFFCKDKVVMYYPYYNNYMYISGCNGLKDEDKCDHILKPKAVARSIKRSLIMGTDPYVTLAIGVIEKFNHDFNTSITWDKTIPPKFWLSGAMGCHYKSAKDGVREIYDETGKVKSPSLLELGNRIKQYIHNEGGSTSNKKGYFCYKQGESFSKYHSKPVPESCCIETPFYSRPEKTRDRIQSALMFHYIKTHTKSPLTCKKKGEAAKEECQKGRWNHLYEKDPAFNIQRFQGYSKLHGGDEPVNAWRSGVNHFKTPVYGYQVMDYLINTLYTNPLIKDLVKKTQEELQVPSPRSLLCTNSKPGVYLIDTDHYFNLGRDARRLNNVFQIKDTAWDSLSRAQRRVMIAEFGDPTVRNGDPETGKAGLLSHFDDSEKKILARLTKLDFSSMRKLIKGVWKNEESSIEHSDTFNKAMKIYFDQYYGPRSSRGKASNYPWKKISDEKFEKLIRKLN